MLSPALPDRLDDLAGAADLLRDELDRGVEPDDARAALLQATGTPRPPSSRGSRPPDPELSVPSGILRGGEVLT